MNYKPIVHEMFEMIDGSRHCYFPTVTNGDAGRGDTLEARVFNITRNNSKGADFRGEVELKAHSETTRYFRPFTMSGGGEKWLADNYGTISQKHQVLCFNRAFRHGEKVIRQTGGQTRFDLSLDTAKLTLTAPDRTVSEWDRAAVEKRLEEKFPSLLMVKTRKSVRDGITHYNYCDATLYEELDIGGWWDIVREGRVTLDHRVRQTDKGTAFKMKISDLPRMFRQKVSLADYKETYQ